MKSVAERLSSAAWILLALAVLATGCGPGPGVAVSGAVTYQGKPVEDGMIQFIPSAETQGPTAGAEIKDGKYSIPAQSGPVPGSYRVEVSSYRDVKKATQKDLAGA